MPAVIMDKPLTNHECEVRIANMIVTIEKTEEKKAQKISEETEIEVNALKPKIKEKMDEIDKLIEKRKAILQAESNLFISRLQNNERIKLLIERDKSILDIVLATHNRLGKVDHKAHRKAYRRILYALVLQALCKLMEFEVLVKFRKTDLRIGMSVLKQASQQFEKMTGKSILIHTSTDKFLPIESCGGVDVFEINGTKYVRNSLSERLDQVLKHANPLIRHTLFGPNLSRKYHDLSIINRNFENKTLMKMLVEESNKKKISNEVIGNLNNSHFPDVCY